MTAREEAHRRADYVDGTHMSHDDWLEARTEAASDAWEPLLRAMVDAGYLDINDETGDQWCHFCGSDYLGSNNIFAKFDNSKMEHEINCAWVQAKEALND